MWVEWWIDGWVERWMYALKLCCLVQVFRPKDEKLEEFWIDFNVGSGCVSFFTDEPQVDFSTSLC